MHLLIIEPSAVPGNWEWMRELLIPAIEGDDERDEGDILADLIAGRMSAYVVSGEMDGIVVTQQTGPWLWIVYAAGKIQPPLAANVQRLVQAFQNAAEAVGSTQIHIIGRDGWIKTLKAMGYELFGRVRGKAHLRKVLR